MTPYSVAALYCFTPINEDEIPSIRVSLERAAERDSVCGLLILGAEGLNTTLAAPKRDGLERFISECQGLLRVERIEAKWSEAPEKPFRRFKIKVREEIVTLDKPDVLPEESRESYLTPAEWDTLLAKPDTVCIDTRNDYEVRIGKFKGAVDPKIQKFSEFPKFMEEQALSKDQNLLIYCTGGIRCEKATTDLKQMGFKNVYQLEGGILRYLKERPNQNFEGECFVFDHRVAVDQKLEASLRYDLCPQCGDPADQLIKCKECGSEAKICVGCIEKSEKQPDRMSCSKNCRYHVGRKLGLFAQPDRKRERRERRAEARSK